MLFPFGDVASFEALVDGAVDVFGNLTATYAAPVSVPGCGFDPGGGVAGVGGSEELYSPGRDVVVTQPRLFCPVGVVVSSRDRVTVRGLVFEVSGDAAVFVSPFTGWAPGVVVRLKKVDG